MKSYHLNKSFVIGVLVLFIGIGFQPVFAITPNIPENYEECSECRELSKIESALLKMQLTRLEKYTKLLIGLLKNNPDVSEKCEYLLGYINSVIGWRFPVICNILPKIIETLDEICSEIEYLVLWYISIGILLFFYSYYYSLCYY